MNQYTTVPGESASRDYDENGNLVQNGAALPATFRHDYLDRIIEVTAMPVLDLSGGVPTGNEFSDDFDTGLDSAWVYAPAMLPQLPSGQWNWNSGGLYRKGDGPGELGLAARWAGTQDRGHSWRRGAIMVQTGRVMQRREFLLPIA